MVPVRLWLRNFLSYGDTPQELDLTDVHVAALVGNNGAGKSALLDALTWVLFGEARSGNEQLLRKGATDMEVALEFWTDGQLYRVRRRFTRRGNHHTARLDQHDRVSGKWKPIVSNDRVTSVSRELQRLLRMDYTTFINTVFMPQGRSGEFMNLAPSERREVLASVLGLGDYEVLAEKARKRVNELVGQIHAVAGQIRLWEEELQERPEVVAAFETACREQEQARQRHEAMTEEVKRWQQEREALLQKEAMRQGLQKEADALLQQMDEAKKRISDAERELQEQQKIVSREADIVKAMGDYEKAQRAEELLAKKAEQAQALQQQRQHLEHAIAQARWELEAEMRLCQQKRDDAQRQLAELERFLSQRPEVERQIKELKRARAELQEWDKKRQQLEQVRQKRAELEKRIAEEQAALAKREGELRQTQQQLQARLAQKPELQKRLKELEEKQKQLAEWQHKAEEAQRKREQATARLAALQTHAEGLKKQLEETDEKLQLLKEHEGEPKCPLCESALTPQRLMALRRKLTKEMEQLQGELQQVQGQQNTVMKAISELDAFLHQAQVTLQKRSVLEQRMGELQQALNEITRTEEALKEWETAWQTFQQERTQSERRWQKERQGLDEWEQAIGYDAERHAQAQSLVEQMAKAEALMEQIADAERQAEHRRKELGQLNTTIADLQKRLESDDYAHQERAALQQTDEQIKALGYDAQQHQKLREWLKTNQHILQWWQKLQTVKEQIPKLQQAMEQGRQAMATAQERLTEISGQLQTLQGELQRSKDVEARLSEAERQRDISEERLRQIAERVGALRQRLEELARREQALEQSRQQLEQWRQEKRDYELLAEAFGRNGIPKQILQVAVQWLEQEANYFLTRLTKGQMHLRFALTQPTQKGTEKETLDIIVADALGDRPYGSYSGGEKFRIDFAVRIAMARLLARRSGAALRTLVIDEGFGSQDKEGLEAMVDAIQTVAKEFDRVLVVTHLDELRDQFPTLVEVTKEQGGSRLRFVGRNALAAESA